MHKLGKNQLKDKSDLIVKLGEAADAAREAVAEVNAMIADKLNPAIEAYNEVLTSVGEFRDGIVGEMEEYFYNRSENWQNGDRGSEYSSWKDEWEGFDISEIDAVEEVDEPEFNHGDEFDAVPDEPNS